MAHSTAIPATAKSDWYTFLCSAFIDGLKAYGAALMVAAPSTPSESQPAVCQSKPAIPHRPVAKHTIPALPHPTKPAWSRA